MTVLLPKHRNQNIWTHKFKSFRQHYKQINADHIIISIIIIVNFNFAIKIRFNLLIYLYKDTQNMENEKLIKYLIDFYLQPSVSYRKLICQSEAKAGKQKTRAFLHHYPVLLFLCGAAKQCEIPEQKCTHHNRHLQFSQIQRMFCRATSEIGWWKFFSTDNDHELD